MQHHIATARQSAQRGSDCGTKGNRRAGHSNIALRPASAHCLARSRSEQSRARYPTPQPGSKAAGQVGQKPPSPGPISRRNSVGGQCAGRRSGPITVPGTDQMGDKILPGGGTLESARRTAEKDRHAGCALHLTSAAISAGCQWQGNAGIRFKKLGIARHGPHGWLASGRLRR